MFEFAKLYAWLYLAVRKTLGKNIRGLGFILRLVRSEHIFEIRGRKMWFNYKVAATYGTLIAGGWQEPETHSILGHVIEKLSGRIAFIDIGANIGAMMVDMARFQNITCYGFEPSKECILAINRSMDLNGSEAVCINKLVGDVVCEIPFYEGNDVGAASVLSQDSKSSGELIVQTTLDAELNLAEDHVIILVDVEGYEPQVLRGGDKLIKEKHPLIIFEYNFVSKQHFSIADIQNILGADYKIFRLRKDTKLDSDVENAWNCVAIPRHSIFEHVLSPLIIRNAN